MNDSTTAIASPILGTLGLGLKRKSRARTGNCRSLRKIVNEFAKVSVRRETFPRVSRFEEISLQKGSCSSNSATIKLFERYTDFQRTNLYSVEDTVGKFKEQVQIKVLDRCILLGVSVICKQKFPSLITSLRKNVREREICTSLIQKLYYKFLFYRTNIYVWRYRLNIIDIYHC